MRTMKENLTYTVLILSIIGVIIFGSWIHYRVVMLEQNLEELKNDIGLICTFDDTPIIIELF